VGGDSLYQSIVLCITQSALTNTEMNHYIETFKSQSKLMDEKS